MMTFVVIPTRNDAWIIETVLKAADLFADQIIVADENSTDATPEICKKFPKVKLVSFEPKKFNESYRRTVLLEAVRQWDGQNLVFGLDSDEILTAQILNPNIRQDLISKLKPGMSAKLQWIMLWKNASQYRYDATIEWSKNYKEFVYWDDRRMAFEDVRMHSSRVPEAAAKQSIIFEDIKVLHYNFAEWERCMAKHRYYLALEKTMGSTRHPYLLDRRYHWFEKKPSGGPIIKNLPADWTAGYMKRGVDITNFKFEPFYWYEAEVLKFFKRFGEKAFKHYNIWDIDWEQKRRQGLAAGERGLSANAISNPQPWYDRFYYKTLAPLSYQI